MRLDPKIKAILDEAGVPWELKHGGIHVKILVGNRLAAILPHKGKLKDASRAQYNTIAQLHRAIRREKENVVS